MEGDDVGNRKIAGTVAVRLLHASGGVGGVIVKNHAVTIVSARRHGHDR